MVAVGLRDLRGLWPRLVPLFIGFERQQFETEGAAGGEPWAPFEAWRMHVLLRAGYAARGRFRLGEVCAACAEEAGLPRWASRQAVSRVTPIVSASTR